MIFKPSILFGAIYLVDFPDQFVVMYFLQILRRIFIRCLGVVDFHQSSKTTEIYTYITTKGFNQIKSPLDGLEDL